MYTPPPSPYPLSFLKVSAVLSSFLEHVQKEKLLRVRCGHEVCLYILSHWSQLNSWWGDASTADQKMAAINILKKMFAIDQKVLIFVYSFISDLITCFMYYFQLLSQNGSDLSVVEPVFAMYLNLIEDTNYSLAFKVCLASSDMLFVVCCCCLASSDMLFVVCCCCYFSYYRFKSI